MATFLVAFPTIDGVPHVFKERDSTNLFQTLFQAFQSSGTYKATKTAMTKAKARAKQRVAKAVAKGKRAVPKGTAPGPDQDVDVDAHNYMIDDMDGVFKKALRGILVVTVLLHRRDAVADW